MSLNHPRHGVQPSKKQIQSMLADGDCIQRIAKDSVAVYILLTVAMDYAEDIKLRAAKHGLFVGFMKHEYTALDKAMRNYEIAFRDTVPIEHAKEFFDGYDKSGSQLEGYIEDNKDVFARLFSDVKELAENYVAKNVENDDKELNKTLDKLK